MPNNRIEFSVIIPTFTPRLAKATALAQELERQIGDLPAEYVMISDNQRMPIGEKVNLLTYCARGRFVAAMGDDDWPRPHYIKSILSAIEHPETERKFVDVINFHCFYTVNGEPKAIIKEGKDFGTGTKQAEDGGLDIYFRQSSDKMAWRRDLLLEHPQTEKWEAADIDFCNGIAGTARNEINIDDVLYDFRYYSIKEDGKAHRKMLDKERGRRVQG